MAAMGINLALGVLYSWSVIKKAIPAEWGWTDADKALPFSIACIVFALVMVPAGRLQDRIGPRWLATAGGILTGIGCIVASFATSVSMYVLGFGVLAGIGIGLGYASATPPAVKWFSAKKTGMIAGIVVAGFGLASVYISPLANYIAGNNPAGKPRAELAALVAANDSAAAEFDKAVASAKETRGDAGLSAAVKAAETKKVAAADALRKSKEENIHKILLYFGIGFLLLVTLLSQFLKVPEAGYVPAEVSATGAGAAAAVAKAAVNVPPSQMLKTPLFYFLWIMFAFASGAGLMVIANLSTIAKLGKVEAGFALVALLAIGNASGRVIAGMLSDKIGRLWTMFIVFTFQAALMMVFRTGLTDIVAFVAISMLIGFNYGACLSLFPSATKDYFGLKNFGVTYGLVFTSWGVGGFLFPYVAGKIFEVAKTASATGEGNYNQAFLVSAIALTTAALLTFATRIAEKSFKEKQA